MRNIKLIIEYDGGNYFGWQKQNNCISIQETIEKAIFKITGENINIIGSSRTDSGVHAKGMVANFHTNSGIPENRFREAINTKLPDDIAIIKSEEVSENFHARYNSRGKTYSYTIVNREEKVALNRNYCYVVKDKLDIELMKEACKLFIGEHDFSAFRSTGSSVRSSVRTVADLHLDCLDNTIKFFITGNGFLYNMVRIIVGTILEVGMGKKDLHGINEAFSTLDRNMAGPCAPARGLVLEEENY